MLMGSSKGSGGRRSEIQTPDEAIKAKRTRVGEIDEEDDDIAESFKDGYRRVSRTSIGKQPQKMVINFANATRSSAADNRGNEIEKNQDAESFTADNSSISMRKEINRSRSLISDDISLPPQRLRRKLVGKMTTLQVASQLLQSLLRIL
jgi:hypothetical protein